MSGRAGTLNSPEPALVLLPVVEVLLLVLVVALLLACCCPEVPAQTRKSRLVGNFTRVAAIAAAREMILQHPVFRNRRKGAAELLPRLPGRQMHEGPASAALTSGNGAGSHLC